MLEQQDRMKDITDKSGEITVEELQLENYSTYQPTREELYILQYWINKQIAYPKLASVACDILATPATIAPVERIFSSAGEATKGKRNRPSDKKLEREIFLRRNQKYINM